MGDDGSISTLGEFGLIARINTLLGPSRVPVGIGDDAAVLDLPGPENLLATVDMLVEFVHFRPGDDMVDVGRRALAVNLSDIAAMGGTPSVSLVSLAIPASTTEDRVEALYRGLGDEARRYGAPIVGGNLTSTPGPLCVDVIILGKVPKGEELLRSGAKPGDLLVVTGPLGERTVARLLRERTPSATGPSVPVPRLDVGRALARARIAHAAIDISDGLGSDIHHIAEQSKVGAVIDCDRIPIAESTRRGAAELGLDPTEAALFGGEDYELLLAIPPLQLERARELVGDVQLHVLGNVTEEDAGVVRRDRGELAPLLARGWQHF